MSKIASYEHIQKSITSKSHFSKTWRGMSQNMIDITRKTILLLLFNIIIKIVVLAVWMDILLLIVPL